MDIKELQKNWNEFGRNDPLWAILSLPDKQWSKWQVDEFFKTGVKEIEAVMKYVESLGVTIPRNKALDFGCGIGRLTQALTHYFDEVWGVDIAPSMIELALKYNRKGCRYTLNETDNLKVFTDNSFDFIYTNITLQHMKPRYARKYIKEFLRVLAPQGLLLFQQPSELIVELPLQKKMKEKVSVIIATLVKTVTPTKLLNVWLPSYHKGPIMECYGIRKEELVKFLKENGAQIMDIVQDQSTPGWVSFQYCVTKE